MDMQPPEDFDDLLRMIRDLQAEVLRLNARVTELTEANMAPTFVGVNKTCLTQPQLEAQMQQAIIEVPDITTVELRMPGNKSHFYHKCYMCKERFPSSFREPKQCPRCGTHRWVDGLTKWDRKKPRPVE